MNCHSLVIGAGAFLLIGLFHLLVIWGKYYFSKKIWPVFLLAGFALLLAALFTKGEILSPLKYGGFLRAVEYKGTF